MPRKKLDTIDLEEFNRRVDWEIAVEFGYNALLGRTLEKTGSSGVFFNSKQCCLVGRDQIAEFF